ncbi:MAG: hypothetical protein QM625_22505 [Ralstonia sp.]|uniref:hypothetical protein n=1 Tax=Ralstonia TaxID=48736 RepID=UPI00211CCD1E|nr:hypothetical protein [Ralstonia pickettii]
MSAAHVAHCHGHPPSPPNIRKALLCNGMYDAPKSAQQRFSSGEAGHLQAPAILNAAMAAAGDPDVPVLSTAADLSDVSINKQQCK